MSTRNGCVRNQKKHKVIAVVESDQSTEQHGRNRSYFRHEDRNAKLLATLKMQSSSAEYSVQTLTDTFSKASCTLQPKKHKPMVTKRLKERRHKRTTVSVSTQPGNTKASTSSSEVKKQPSSLTTQAYTTGPLEPIAEDSMPDGQCSRSCTPTKLPGKSNCTVDISPTKLHHRMLSTGQFSFSPPASVPQSVPQLSNRLPVNTGAPKSPLPVESGSPALAVKQEISSPAVALKQEGSSPSGKHVKTFSIPLKRITVS